MSNIISPDFSEDNVYNATSKDYLQDASMWWDNLPQPFRLINDLLQVIFDTSWDTIEENSKAEREKERNARLVKESEEGTLMSSIPEANLLHYVRVGERELLFGVGSLGLYCTESNKMLASTSFNGVANSISAGILKGATDIVAVAIGTRESGVKLVALTGSHFIEINELIVDGINTVIGVTLSKGSSYLAIHGYTDQNIDHSIKLFTLPTDNWTQQLESSQINFNKPVLLYSIISAPPSTVYPCSFTDPIQIMKHIQSNNSQCIPTGSHHGLTENYLTARRNNFVSYRRDFVTEIDKDNNKIVPNIYFLHYWKLQYSNDIPIAIAIVWKLTNQVHLYSLTNSKGKNPDIVYTQCSYITSSTICSSYIAIGLLNGIISLYDTLTNNCLGVVCCSPGTPITSLCIAQALPDAIVLISGCGNGKINCVKWAGIGNITTKCLNSSFNTSNEIVHVYSNSLLHSTVTSVHDDGTIIIWDWINCIPLVQLVLPLSYTVAIDSVLTTSDSIVAVAKTSTGDTQQHSVFSWNLSTCEGLRKTSLSECKSNERGTESGTVYEKLVKMTFFKNSTNNDSSLEERIKKKWTALCTV